MKYRSIFIAGMVCCTAIHTTARAATYNEANGIVVIEAEDYTSKKGTWFEVDSPSGSKALFANKGKGDYVSYEITFTGTGKYYLWGFGKAADDKADDFQFWWNRPVNTAKGDNISYLDGGRDFELSLQGSGSNPSRQEWKWTNWAKDKSKTWDNNSKIAFVEVPSKGTYTMYLSKGGEPEGGTGYLPAGSTERRYGYDKFVLKKQNVKPDGYGPQATYASTSIEYGSWVKSGDHQFSPQGAGEKGFRSPGHTTSIFSLNGSLITAPHTVHLNECTKGHFLPGMYVVEYSHPGEKKLLLLPR